MTPSQPEAANSSSIASSLDAKMKRLDTGHPTVNDHNAAPIDLKFELPRQRTHPEPSRHPRSDRRSHTDSTAQALSSAKPQPQSAACEASDSSQLPMIIWMPELRNQSITPWGSRNRLRDRRCR